MRILFLSVMLMASAWAQGLRGVLYERGTKTRLSEVNVFVLPDKMRATTNQRGEFEFPQAPAGEFEFVVNHTGYIRLTQKGGAQKEYELFLERESYDAFETTVTALAKKKDFSRKSLSQKDFLKAPGAQEDPVKAVQNLAGVAQQSGSAQVVIQGSAPDDTRYNINGHEVPLIFHFGGLSSVVMPQAVDEVEFLSSGYGPEFGRALGGIINLKTRAPKRDRTHGMAFVDLYNTGGLIEGPIGEKSSYFVGLRQSYIGEVLKQVAEETPEFDLTVAPTFSDIFTMVDHRLSDRDYLSLLMIRSKDELQFVLNEPVASDATLRGDFKQSTEFWRVIPRWQRRLSDSQELDLSLGYGDNNIFVEIGDRYFDLQTTTFSQRAELKTRQSESYTHYLGVDSQRVSYDVGLRLPSITSSGGVTNPSAGKEDIGELAGADWESAVYMRNEVKLTPQWTFFPNARVSTFTQTDQTYLMPRVSLSYAHTPSLVYAGAVGLYYQAPQNGEATEEFGNPDLSAEKAVHYTVSLTKDFRGGGSQGVVLETSLFYKTLSDLIIQSDRLRSDGTPERYSNEGTGTIKGLQLEAKWRLAEWQFVGAYTLLDSLRKNPGQEEVPSEYDQTHNLNLITSYERGRWTYSARLRYVTGRPYTPVEGGVFDADNDVYIPVRGSLYSDRFDPFTQLDIRFDRKWVYDQWILSGYLDIQNVTNSENPQSISYSYDYSEKVATRGLPILPIFGVKGEF